MFLHLKLIYFFETTHCKGSGGIIFFLSLSRLLLHILKSMCAFSSHVFPVLSSACSTLSPNPSVDPQQNLIHHPGLVPSVTSTGSLLKLFPKCNIPPLPWAPLKLLVACSVGCGPCVPCCLSPLLDSKPLWLIIFLFSPPVPNSGPGTQGFEWSLVLTHFGSYSICSDPLVSISAL